METVTHAAAETQALGRELAQRLKGGEIIGLIGDLGSGKTTFIQGLAQGLGIDKRIISPTFVFQRSYRLPGKRGGLDHLDLYRIGGWDDARGLGLEELWSKKKGIVVMEWAEKIEEKLPPKTIKIFFEYLGQNKRKIKTDYF